MRQEAAKQKKEDASRMIWLTRGSEVEPSACSVAMSVSAFLLVILLVKSRCLNGTLTVLCTNIRSRLVLALAVCVAIAVDSSYFSSAGYSDAKV